MTENVKYIEECIYQQQSLTDTLRLMCLYSLVKDGLPAETYESLKSIFLQVCLTDNQVRGRVINSQQIQPEFLGYLAMYTHIIYYYVHVCGVICLKWSKQGNIDKN